MEIIYYEKLNMNKKMHEYADFDGVTFSKMDKNYYSFKIKMNLHRYVYCYYNGIDEIPRDCCIHHVDHNHSNNNILNLKLITISEHSIFHSSSITEETRKKMSDARKGKKLSEETKKRMSISATGKKHKPMTEKQKQQISKANTGRYARNHPDKQMSATI